MILYPEVPAWRQVLAYVVAVPVAFAAAGGLYTLLARFRRGSSLSRFVARFWIIGAFYFVFALVMGLVGGPYVFAGRMRSGSYDRSSLTAGRLVGLGLAIGTMGAVLWPLVGRRGGDDLDL